MAWRIAVRNGLTDHAMPLEEAERWCDAWEREAARPAEGCRVLARG